MIPEFRASDILDQFTQGHSGGLLVPRVREPTLPHDGTIDPSWLTSGNHELPSQLTLDPVSLYPSGDGHYQCPSPATSNFEVWMGFPGDGASPSAHSPISPTVGDGSTTYVAHMDTCMCGCGGGSCIPQREYDRQRTDPLSQDELQELIIFSVNGKCGYPLEHALKKQYTGLDGRDEKMFAEFKSSISIRLEWLPYEKWTKQVRTLTWRNKPDHITRAKLSTEVAKRMKAFFQEMINKEADISYREYRVQPGIVDLEHLELVALKRVSKSSWMPHFRLIPPSQPL